jgi:hypothetical protein
MGRGCAMKYFYAAVWSALKFWFWLASFIIGVIAFLAIAKALFDFVHPVASLIWCCLVPFAATVYGEYCMKKRWGLDF